MMQGYRNLPGRYDVLPKGERKKLWGFLFHGQAAILRLQHYRQILVWFQLWDADRRLSRCWSRGLSVGRWTEYWPRWMKGTSHDRRHSLRQRLQRR